MNNFLRTFYWWRRLMRHLKFHLDDYYIYPNFWYSLSIGYHEMEYDYKWKTTWEEEYK